MDDRYGGDRPIMAKMLMKVQRRFDHTIQVGEPLTLAVRSPHVVDGRTKFRARVEPVSDYERIFKSGMHNRKIGDRVVKGAWKGMKIFTLTLEERATCPRSCLHWRDCYGNKMQWSTRLKHGSELEDRIKFDIRRLSQRFPNGFVVRLHVLGDFYSVGYVHCWFSLLRAYPNLRIYGYTAWQPHTEIGEAVQKLNTHHPTRCIIRISDYPHDKEFPRTITLNTEDEAPDHVIVCPAQTGKTDCCGTCALCWAVPDKTIAFLRH